MCSSFVDLELIFETEFGAVGQCPKRNCYFLKFQDCMACFTVQDFFDFKKRIDSINIPSMLEDTSRKSDFELVMPYRCGVFFVLDVPQIVNLKDLLEGAKFTIQLNSFLQTIGVQFSMDQEELA